MKTELENQLYSSIINGVLSGDKGGHYSENPRQMTARADQIFDTIKRESTVLGDQAQQVRDA